MTIRVRIIGLSDDDDGATGTGDLTAALLLAWTHKHDLPTAMNLAGATARPTDPRRRSWTGTAAVGQPAPRSVYPYPNSVYPYPNSVYPYPNSDYQYPRSVYSYPNSVYPYPNSDYKYPHSDYRYSQSDYQYPPLSALVPVLLARSALSPEGFCPMCGDCGEHMCKPCASGRCCEGR